MVRSRAPREVLRPLRNRLLIPAFVALLAGLGGVAFGLARDDVVRANRNRLASTGSIIRYVG